MIKQEYFQEAEQRFLENACKSRAERQLLDIMNAVANEAEAYCTDFSLRGCELLYHVVKSIDDLIDRECDEIYDEADLLRLAKGLREELVSHFRKVNRSSEEAMRYTATLVVGVVENLFSIYDRDRYYRLCDSLVRSARKDNEPTRDNLERILGEIMYNRANHRSLLNWMTEYLNQEEPWSDDLTEGLLGLQQSGCSMLLTKQEREAAEELKRFFLGSDNEKKNKALQYVFEIRNMSDAEVVAITKGFMESLIPSIKKKPLVEILQKYNLYSCSYPNFMAQFSK